MLQITLPIDDCDFAFRGRRAGVAPAGIGPAPFA